MVIIGRGEGRNEEVVVVVEESEGVEEEVVEEEVEEEVVGGVYLLYLVVERAGLLRRLGPREEEPSEGVELELSSIEGKEIIH